MQDQRGFNRSGACDIGAYEFNTTTTALQSSLNPSQNGQAVIFTATVTSVANIPTGSVTFQDNAVGVLGNGTLDALGVATFTTSTLTTGTHAITAVYNGDSSNMLSVSPIVSQVVNDVPSNGGVVVNVGGGASPTPKAKDKDFVGGGDVDPNAVDYVGAGGDVDANGNPINPFTDTIGHWAEADITTLAHDCNVRGYQDVAGNLLHLFKPDIQITRAELLTMVLKCKDGVLPALTKNSSFPDVAADYWAAPYIERGLEDGVIEGYRDGTFKPDQYATRAEALKMILLVWVSTENIQAALPVTNCNDVVPSEWYARYFNYAFAQGIANGYSNDAGEATDLCGPNNNITRAETAKFVVKVKGM